MTSFLASRVRRAQTSERFVQGVADAITGPVGRVEEGLHADAEDDGEEEPSGCFGVDVRAEKTRVPFGGDGLLDADARSGGAGALLCGQFGVGGGQAEEGEQQPPVADTVLVEG